MKLPKLAFAASLALAAAAPLSAQDVVPIDAATGSVSQVTIGWQSDPDTTYVVKKCSFLPGGEWERTSGNIDAGGWTLEQTLPADEDVVFYRVERVDQAGPSFEYLAPAKDAISIASNAAVRVAIADPSGIDTNTLAIYVGDVRHGLGSPGVEWTDGVLSYDPAQDADAGCALGAPGDTVEVWAAADDALGNTGAAESSLLVLARPPEAVQSVDICVIGASSASAAAVVRNASASAAAARDASGTVSIVEVTDDTLVFAYTGDIPLAVGQLWASTDPDNIFYRRILDWTETEAGILTADTEDVTLADFFVGGSFSSDDESWAEYEVEEVGTRVRRRLVRPRIGGSTARSFSTNGVIRSSLVKIPDGVPLAWEGDLGSWDVNAGFSVAADFALLKGKFRSCDLAVNGGVHLLLDPKLVATTNAAYSNTWTKTLANVKKTFGGTIGPVPVWVDLQLELPLELQVQAEATNASVAATVEIRRDLDFHWRLDDDAWKQIGNGNPGWQILQTNFTYEVEGSAGVRVSLKPTLTVKVYSLVGAYGWVEPYLEANAKGQVRGQNLQAPDFYYLLTAYAGLDAEIGLASTIWSDSWGTPPHKTFSPLRKQLLYLEGTNTSPRIVDAPADYVADNGETVMFSVNAEGTWPLRYFWYHNGVDTGRRDKFITLTAGEATAGDYEVVVKNGYGTATATATLGVVTNIPVIGAWRFLYQWEGQKTCSYAARIYADGGMRDTSPNAFWWDWHLNGKTFRFETRTKWDGASAVYRGVRKTETYISGTMTSPAGLSGTWSMEWVSADPDASLAALRSAAAAPDAAGAAAGLDPAGMPFGGAAAE